ncbi:MAG TPA: family 10 glycosylhydrolase [Candidatus Dormibacteraeota bacterium]|nr:family 10 glycosylhydrolase [Candidatus Dormibacteraeota bacterium]
MKFRAGILSASVLFLPAMLFAANFIYQPVTITPPNPPREFRGAWIATVANIDWPSKFGLTVDEQKAELISLLDRAVQLHLNAIIFQVRPVCDAMYASPLEPWSEYLTGAQGRAPQPFYDPLAFAIGECHKRGLELHAWFNPFRASHPQSKSPVAANHITRTHPELVRKFGDQLWLDPGEPAVRQYVLRVVMDVVKRYDVDGVQFDDYFYPYPQKDSAGRALDFPDYATWKKYGLPDKFERDDWRRQNVDQFIQGVYQNIKAAKPWVKFGISPFGIWRPHFPNQIQGLDAYANLYADSRKWLAEGWLDYFAPQLYWPIDQREQSFPVLLQWWRGQNVKGRNLWPGLSAANVGDKFSAGEITRQIQIARGQNVNGEIFYHLRNLTDNPAFAGIIRSEYPQAALVPASPWLDSTPPGKPRLAVTTGENSRLSVRWENSGGEPAWLWVLQFRANGVWATQILPANRTDRVLENPTPDAISIRAVDRVGNLSAPVVLSPQMPQKTAPALPDRIRPDLNWPPRKQ